MQRLLLILVSYLLIHTQSLSAHTANMVWFEFMQDGRYKVIVGYTIPELKEFRESYVIFNSKKKAERYYWALVRGADFFPSNPEAVRFREPKLQPRPW